MTPSLISQRVAADCLEWVDSMLREIRLLPLDDRDAFFADRRNVWTADSCLRRALEAELDLGRHIVARSFGIGVTEYEDIARQLADQCVLSHEDAELMSVLAGYRNRLVHYHHEVSDDEMYEICTEHLVDVERVADAMRNWLSAHPERLDDTL